MQSIILITDLFRGYSTHFFFDHDVLFLTMLSLWMLMWHKWLALCWAPLHGCSSVGYNSLSTRACKVAWLPYLRVVLRILAQNTTLRALLILKRAWQCPETGILRDDLPLLGINSYMDLGVVMFLWLLPSREFYLHLFRGCDQINIQDSLINPRIFM